MTHGIGSSLAKVMECYTCLSQTFTQTHGDILTLRNKFRAAFLITIPIFLDKKCILIYFMAPSVEQIHVGGFFPVQGFTHLFRNRQHESRLFHVVKQSRFMLAVSWWFPCLSFSVCSRRISVTLWYTCCLRLLMFRWVSEWVGHVAGRPFLRLLSRCTILKTLQHTWRPPKCN